MYNSKMKIIEQSLKHDEEIVCNNATVIADKYGNVTAWVNNDEPLCLFKVDKYTDTQAMAKRHSADSSYKLIPKKPIGDLHSVPHYRCPNCNNAVALYRYDYKYPNCKWCGQALDWE